jgi:hypothetical protein
MEPSTPCDCIEGTGIRTTIPEIARPMSQSLHSNKEAGHLCRKANYADVSINVCLQ